jgi:hypothetical protein
MGYQVNFAMTQPTNLIFVSLQYSVGEMLEVRISMRDIYGVISAFGLQAVM